MNIVLIHFEKVPVLHYGGTERIVEALALGFRELGHKVTMMSYRGDYEIDGIERVFLDHLRSDPEMLQKTVWLIPDKTDIVHFNLAMGQERYDMPPYLITLHGNLREADDYSKIARHTVGISNDHAIRHNLKHFVYNGLDFSNVQVGPSAVIDRKYFSFLGRASLKRKGLSNAKKISKACSTQLLIGGGRGISFGNNRYLGHLNNSEKYELLKNSKALLFPIEWQEPFGLVMIEAMACGAPVFAHKRGSVAEVLGMNGSEEMFLIAENADDLISKIKEFKYKHIASDYRNYVESHFSHLKMCENYLEKYRLILSRIF